MVLNFIIFLGSLFLVIRGATIATKYSARLAEKFHLSQYFVGFIIVAVISILPETFILINSAIEKVPTFGLGVIFGSNVADLTLIFAILVLFTGKGLKIESKILKNQKVFPFLLMLPLILGIDGFYSRIDGLVLIISGIVFYYLSLRDEIATWVPPVQKEDKRKEFLLSGVGILMLLIGAHFVVTSATTLAQELGVSSVLIGMLVVGLGTTIPEAFFSFQAAKKENDSLAVGDLLGTVLMDATIVVGVLAIFSPFSFPVKIIYSTGFFMVMAAIALFYFMRSGKNISRREGIFLIFFWILFALIEFIINS